MFVRLRILLTGLLIVMLAGACQNHSTGQERQDHNRENFNANGYGEGELAMFQPRQRPFRKAYLDRLRVPAGFEIGVFARNAGHARMMTVLEDGTVLVSRPNQGDVLALRDTDGDGEADSRRVVVSGIPDVHGLVVRQGQLYLAAPRRVFVTEIRSEGAYPEPRPILDNLPAGGRHPYRTLGIGPDNRLYISVGSSCNACEEENPEHAAILRAPLSGGEREIFAEGLRNTIGFGWHPQTGEMWGMDIGTDWVGADDPPEELNRLEAGAHYGWPWCFGDRQEDPTVDVPPPDNLSRFEFCARTRPAVLTHQAHSTPIGWAFYTERKFPLEYQGDAFIPLRGSWNRYPAVGYGVARVDFKNGEPVAIEPFITGFLIEDGDAHFGRPAGAAVTPDGALLISDDVNGVIYRVTYRVE